jgi:hypothetical protein
VVNKIVTLCTGNKYGEEYVENLFNALDRNTTVPFKFECIRESEFPGWWGKVEIFPPKERIVFLDLDTIIVDNCDFLFQYKGPFCILRDFYRKDGYGSAVMSIAPGFGAEISRTFLANPEDAMKKVHGDQNWIERNVKDADLWQDKFPGKIVSFKVHCNGKYPAGAAVVCTHGFPKPHQITHIPWVKENWR